ncbi:MAG: D-alanyl-D-alanine carboxypeptidase [Clostridia bacterium]|nr:D-alanyl-D-alanine carboxypeptidase [Clostridia bacterium]
MKQPFTRLCCLCLCLLLFLPLVTVRAAADDGSALPSLEEARAVWLSHVESGKLILSKAESTSVGAGSSVKVMSGLLLCELYANRFYDSIYISDELWDAVKGYGGHSMELNRYDEYQAYDLLYAALCGSYNNAFYVLAYYVTDGSVDSFISMMNTRAEELGMTSTYFEDLTGVAGASRTTAQDMARLAAVAYQNQNYMTLCDTDSYAFESASGKQYQFYNNNSLICQYKETRYYQPYCSGMSAGSTTADGNCVVTVAKHGEETYICVVLGGNEVTTNNKTDKYGYIVTNRLVDWVYATYSYVEVLGPDVNICTIPVAVSDMVSSVRVRTKESVFAYLPKNVDLQKDITYSIRLTDTEIEAPFEDGTFVGYVAVIYDGQILGTAKLYTVGGAERSTIVSSLKAIQAWIRNRAVIAGFIFFIVATVAWIIVEYILWRRKRHKWDKYFSDKMKLPDKMMRRSGDPNRLRQQTPDRSNRRG